MQIYLEFGHIPARFEIQKLRWFYLKYILSQDKNSFLYKLFYLQLENWLKGDWAYTVLEDLKELKINKSFEEIQKMSRYQFSNLIKTKINENALNYLLNKQMKKGGEIRYHDIEMSEYLQPANIHLNIEEKQKMFAIRNGMTEISENFPNKEISLWKT